MDGGTVYDLEGNRVGWTPDAVHEFLLALDQALADGPCFVLASATLPTAFVESLKKIAPVVLDLGMLPGRCEIIEGHP